MITLHKKNILQFFLQHFGLGNFQAILGKFRGNSDWDLGRISAPNRVQKNHCVIWHVCFSGSFMYMRLKLYQVVSYWYMISDEF